MTPDSCIEVPSNAGIEKQLHWGFCNKSEKYIQKNEEFTKQNAMVCLVYVIYIRRDFLTGLTTHKLGAWQNMCVTQAIL